jgi:hypothetical protein
MSDVGDSNFMRYIYRGEEGEHIPDGATHITVAEDVTFVRARAFERHPNIVEVICHKNVKKIEEEAFQNCPSLKRVIMRGVTVVERRAFYNSAALTDVECNKLEIIKEEAFWECKSLMSIILPSARVVGEHAFSDCSSVTEVRFVEGSVVDFFPSKLAPSLPSRAVSEILQLARLGSKIPLSDVDIDAVVGRSKVRVHSVKHILQYFKKNCV